MTAPLIKKKTWSWSAYLEEERAITAPLKLFKEVRDTAYIACVSVHSYIGNMEWLGSWLGWLVWWQSVFFIRNKKSVTWTKTALQLEGFFFKSWILWNSVILYLWVFAIQHQSFPQSRNGFKVGMKLEGLDPSHPALFCVLTVAEVTRVKSYWFYLICDF